MGLYAFKILEKIIEMQENRLPKIYMKTKEEEENERRGVDTQKDY